MENMTMQVIVGILTGVALWLLNSLRKKLKKLFKAKTINEITNISLSAITNFLPTLASLFVLASEIWLISPRNIIDFIFIQFSIFVIVANFILYVFLTNVFEIKQEIFETRASQNRIQTNLDSVIAEYEASKVLYEEYKALYQQLKKKYEEK